MNARHLLLFLPLTVALLAGCSSETVKRTTYETMQNMRQQECVRDRTTNCPPRKGYNEYQRERQDDSR